MTIERKFGDYILPLISVCANVLSIVLPILQLTTGDLTVTNYFALAVGVFLLFLTSLYFRRPVVDHYIRFSNLLRISLSRASRSSYWFLFMIVTLSGCHGGYVYWRWSQYRENIIDVLLLNFASDDLLAQLNEEIVFDLRGRTADLSKFRLHTMTETVSEADGPAFAQAIGKRAKADYVLWGWIASCDDSLRVACHLTWVIPRNYKLADRNNDDVCVMYKTRNTVSRSRIVEEIGNRLVFLTYAIECGRAIQADDYNTTYRLVADYRASFPDAPTQHQEHMDYIEALALTSDYYSNNNAYQALGRARQILLHSDDCYTAAHFLASYVIAVHNINIGDWVQARDTFDEHICTQYNNDEELYNLLKKYIEAILYLHEKDAESAIGLFDDYLEEPKSLDELDAGVDVMCGAGEYAYADSLARLAIASYPDSAGAWLALGEVCSRSGQYVRGLSAIESALKIDNNSGEAHLAAFILSTLISYDHRDESHLRAARRLLKNRYLGALYFYQGVARLADGDVKSCEADWGSAVKLDSTLVDEIEKVRAKIGGCGTLEMYRDLDVRELTTTDGKRIFLLPLYCL